MKKLSLVLAALACFGLVLGGENLFFKFLFKQFYQFHIALVAATGGNNMALDRHTKKRQVTNKI